MLKAKLFTTQSRLLTALKKEPFEFKTLWENAGNQHCLLFPQCFLFYPEQNSGIFITFNLSFASAFYLDWSKILSFGT